MFRADDPVLLAVGGSVRAALREAVEAHAATLVDGVREAASGDDGGVSWTDSA